MTDYQEALEALIKQIRIDKANAVEIDINAIAFLPAFNPDESNQKLTKFLLAEHICTAPEWKAAVRARRICDKLGTVPKTSREFIAAFIDTNALSYRKGFIWQGDERYKNENFEMEVRLLEDDLKLGYKAQILSDSVMWWTRKRQQEEVDAIKAAIFAEPTLPPDELEKMWDGLATEVLDANREAETDLDGAQIIRGHGQSAAFNKAMLKKGIQQVKQKIKNMRVKDHLMLTLLGPQGIGKTTFLKAFLSPIDALVAEPNFLDITDNRNIQLWESYVHLIDEMGYASKAEIDVVKHAITAEHQDRRPMCTNRLVRVPQNATYFGGSNKELNELIRDETGLRRFAGCRFRVDANWDVVNATNYVELWRSVKVDDPDPTGPVRAELVEQQKANRVPNSAELWAAWWEANKGKTSKAAAHPYIEGCGIFRDFSEPLGHTASDMFDSYKHYEEDKKLRPVSEIGFGIMMSGAIKSGKLPKWRVWRRDNVSRYRYVG